MTILQGRLSRLRLFVGRLSRLSPGIASSVLPSGQLSRLSPVAVSFGFTVGQFSPRGALFPAALPVASLPLAGRFSSSPSGGSGSSRCASGSLLPPASSGQPSRLSPGAASFGILPSTDFRAFIVHQSWRCRWPTFPAFTGRRVLWLLPEFTYDLLLVHQLEAH